MTQPYVQMVLPVIPSDIAEIDAILERAITAGDPLIATDFGNSISKTITKKGVALAKLFSGLRDNWPLFRAAGIEEDFPDFVDAHMLVKGRTANRYADMYNAVFDVDRVPASVQEQLKQKPIESLLLLTAAVREGSLDVDDLKDIVLLNKEGIRAKVNQARGEATNSRTRVFARLAQRGSDYYPLGSLVVYGPDGDVEILGNINLHPLTESGKKFLERMKNTLYLEDIR